MRGQLLHFLGEVETVFGIWAVVLVTAITYRFNRGTAVAYVGEHVNFTEPGRLFPHFRAAPLCLT